MFRKKAPDFPRKRKTSLNSQMRKENGCCFGCLCSRKISINRTCRSTSVEDGTCRHFLQSARGEAFPHYHDFPIPHRNFFRGCRWIPYAGIHHGKSRLCLDQSPGSDLDVHLLRGFRGFFLLCRVYYQKALYDGFRAQYRFVWHLHRIERRWDLACRFLI